MTTGALGLILAFLVVGCTKNDLSKNDQPSQTTTVEADNSGRNVRASQRHDKDVRRSI